MFTVNVQYILVNVQYTTVNVQYTYDSILYIDCKLFQRNGCKYKIQYY
jgi:hypothetical protein